MKADQIRVAGFYFQCACDGLLCARDVAEFFSRLREKEPSLCIIGLHFQRSEDVALGLGPAFSLNGDDAEIVQCAVVEMAGRAAEVERAGVTQFGAFEIVAKEPDVAECECDLGVVGDVGDGCFEVAMCVGEVGVGECGFAECSGGLCAVGGAESGFVKIERP